MKKSKVSYNAKSVYDIEPSFFKTLGVKAVICDLDNTLDPADTQVPQAMAFALKDEIEALGIKFLVVSNNVASRVSPYCDRLKVIYLSDARKFSKKRILKFLDDNGLKVDDCIFIGDQIFTDRIYVNALKGRLILTEPLTKKDHFVTRFVRWLDKLIRQKWRKRNLLGQTCPKREK